MTNRQDLLDSAAVLRTEAERLESIATRINDNQVEGTSLPAFDPGRDAPPVTPRVDGDRTQRDWCSIMLWSQLLAVNVRHDRGATPDESREIAKSSGYQDGRAWNQWTGWTKDADGNRWIDETGRGHLAQYLSRVGRSLPEDLQD